MYYIFIVCEAYGWSKDSPHREIKNMLSKYCYTWCEVEKPMFKFDRGFYYVENTCAMDFYVTDFRV